MQLRPALLFKSQQLGHGHQLLKAMHGDRAVDSGRQDRPGVEIGDGDWHTVHLGQGGGHTGMSAARRVLGKIPQTLFFLKIQEKRAVPQRKAPNSTGPQGLRLSTR